MAEPFLTSLFGLKALGGYALGWASSKTLDKSLFAGAAAVKARLKNRKLDPNHDIERAILIAHTQALQFIIEHTFSQPKDKRVEPTSRRLEMSRRGDFSLDRRIKNIELTEDFNGLPLNLSEKWQTVVPATFESAEELEAFHAQIPSECIDAALDDLLSYLAWSEHEKAALEDMACDAKYGWAPSFTACLRDQVKINEAFFRIYLTQTLTQQSQLLEDIRSTLAPNTDLAKAMGRVEAILSRIDETVTDTNVRVRRIETVVSGTDIWNDKGVSSSLQIIDKKFIQNALALGNQGAFTASKFYLGKRSDQYQWFGVLKNWDIERGLYSDIKRRVIESFSTSSSNRISALVTGAGGSGKSTLLRRLAIDCVDQDFCTIWIDDFNISEFVERRLYRKLARDISYLFIIEDWYRIRQLVPKEDLNAFLTNLNNLPLSRICIGDREVDSKVLSLLQGGEAIGHFKLLPDDNQRIVDGVLKQLPRLRKVIGDGKDHISNLKTGAIYSILFTLSRIENADDFSDIELGEIDTHFRKIVASDLKKLSTFHLGVARLLVFWGKLYVDKKFGISTNLIHKLCEWLDPETRKYIPLEAQNILDFYISAEITSENEEVYRFNQDILAEMGVSDPLFSDSLKASNFVFDLNTQHNLLSVLAKSNDTTASSMLQALLVDVGLNRFSFEDLTTLCETAWNNGNYGWHVSAMFRHVDCPVSDSNISEKAEKIINYYFDHSIYSLGPGAYGAYQYLLKTKKSKWSIRTTKRILSAKNITTIYHSMVTSAFRISTDKSAKNVAASLILSNENITAIDSAFISAAFRQSTDETVKNAAANLILSEENITTLHDGIVTAAFRYSSNEPAKNVGANFILSDENITTLHDGIVNSAFNHSTDEIKKNVAANLILSDENITTLHEGIVTAAFRHSTDEPAKNVAANLILSDQNITKLYDGIVTSAFRHSLDQPIKNAAANLILFDEDITAIHQGVITAAFRHSTNLPAKNATANLILSDENIARLHAGIVTAAFRHSTDLPAKNAAAKLILSNENIARLHAGIVAAAFRHSTDLPAKNAIANLILSDENITSIHHGIVTAAFRNSTDDSTKNTAANLILSDENIPTIHNHIVTAAFRHSSDETTKNTAASLILAKWSLTTLPISLVPALLYYLEELDPQASLYKQLQSFVDDHIHMFGEPERKSARSFHIYSLILGVPLHSIKSWRYRTEDIINHWRSHNSLHVHAVMRSYREFPDTTHRLCEAILCNWKLEVSKKYRPILSGHMIIGGTLDFALQHPNLVDHSRVVAQEMLKAQENGFDLPEHFKSKINGILEV